MLRKDLDQVREINRQQYDQTLRQADRIYDQNKWFIGLMFTIALGVVALGVSNFIKKDAPK